MGKTMIRVLEGVNFTTDREDILKALRKSKNEQTVLALSVPSIGAAIFITAVDNIIEHNGTVTIVLKNYDITGFIFEKNKVSFSEILSVCPLASKWKNPYLKNFEEDSLNFLRN